MNIQRLLGLLAVLIILVAASLSLSVWRADLHSDRRVGSVVPAAAAADSPRIPSESDVVVDARREMVPHLVAEPDSSRAEDPQRNTFAVWHGRPRGEFLSSYWGISQQEVLESLVADGFPENLAKDLSGSVVGDHFGEWTDAVPLIKEAIRRAVEGSMGNVETSFSDAWGRSLTNVLTQIGDQSTKGLGPDVSLSGVRSWLQANGNHLLLVHAELLEAVLDHVGWLLETGDVDRFPLATMPQGRGNQRVPTNGARRYKLFQANGGGWVAHVAVYDGASHEVDMQYRRLRESWLDVLPRALMESSGISVSSYDLQQLGLSAN
jgi:hypothetical protein